jgi:hypothetical protein
MKIQIYYNKNYIPFNLYINSIYNIFTTNDYFISNNYEVSIINNIKNFSEKSDYLILFLNNVNDIYFLNTKDTKIIFIHADYFINHSYNDQKIMIKYLNHVNEANSYIWDYNILNINYYNKYFINKKFYLIPLQYNNYLENVYNIFKMNIPHNKKPIDVLFMGSCDSDCRRKLLLDIISKKYKLHIMNNVNDIGTYINIIEKSKIVLNIYSKEINKPFDHYRLALLYSNKVFVINEAFIPFDKEFDTFDKNFENTIIKTDYNNILNLVTEYLNKKEETIEYIKEKTYKLYKKNDMSINIINFFKSLKC